MANKTPEKPKKNDDSLAQDLEATADKLGPKLVMPFGDKKGKGKKAPDAAKVVEAYLAKGTPET